MMSEKKTIIKKLIPRAVLKAMTSQAKEAIPENNRHDDLVRIDYFPYKVGREFRVRVVKGGYEILERRKQESNSSNNDLYLIDNDLFLNISRQHFAIEESEKGFFIVDKGSACGTIVGENTIGGKDKGGTCQLEDGDIIVLGIEGSPFQYQFILLDTVEL